MGRLHTLCSVCVVVAAATAEITQSTESDFNGYGYPLKVPHIFQTRP